MGVSRYVQHAKTGGYYEVLMSAQMEADHAPVVVYQAVRTGMLCPERYGPVWVRPETEFADGRFVAVGRYHLASLPYGPLSPTPEPQP